MHIEPNSTVIVCKDVPWDPDYTHAMNWANMGRDTQASIVKTYKKFEFNQLTYQRTNRGYIRVEKCVDDLFDCNYLMFQNTNYGDKWFYAFITQVNYINDITSEIRYEIDLITTWWFDCTIDTCFIQRAHTTTDNPGDNLNPEGIERGEYIIPEKYSPKSCIENWDLNVMVVTTFGYNKDTKEIDDEAKPTDSNNLNIPSALFYTFFRVGYTLERLAFFDMMDVINKAGKIDGVVGAYVCPTWPNFAGVWTSSQTLKFAPYPRPNDIDGYTPKNKKLLTAPYSLLYITDYMDREITYAYEYFVDPDNVEMSTSITPGPPPSIMVRPDSYKNGAKGLSNFTEVIYSLPYPQVPYVNDVYKNWLAQNQNALISRVIFPAYNWAIGAGSSIANAAVKDAGIAGSKMPYMDAFASSIPGSLIGVAGELLGNIATVEAEKADRRVQPNIARGVGDNLMLAEFFQFGLFYCVKQITAEFAKRIDDYFTMFGYAINELGKPSDYIGKRKSHCYVKTIGAHLSGSVPADSAKAICSIYDNGITFWENQIEIGDYSLDNSPRE